MAYNNFNHGQPQYYYYYPSSSSAPVTFQEPSAYTLDNNYRRDYRRQHPEYRDERRQSFAMAEEDAYGAAEGRPWWLSSDYPHGGRNGNYHLHSWQCNNGQQSGSTTRTDDHRRSTVEMYVPLCCDECERKVRKHLKDLDGVESVSANQWEKKVVVEGYDLHPNFLLRRIQQVKPSSAFWSDRPG